MRPGIVEDKAPRCLHVARRISLRISNFLLSLPFHRKVTPVPFTPVRPCGKQVSIGVIDQRILGSRHAREPEVQDDCHH